MDKKSLAILKIIRPFFHFWIILVAFFRVFKIRQQRDFIPFIHILNPYLNLQNTIIFAILAAFVFVIIASLNNLYSLNKQTDRYFLKFFQTAFIWFLVISGLSYYGQWFFLDAISRFVLIWWVVFSVFLMIIEDSILNNFIKFFEQKDPTKILAIYTKPQYYEYFLDQMKWIKKYQIFWQHVWEEVVTDIQNFDKVVTLWNISRNLLQQISDEAILRWKKLFHIAESSFLDDLIYTPTRLWPIMALQFKPSPLDGWLRVVKRLTDIFGSIFGLIIFSPLFLLLAILIKLDSSWPIFYTQKRVWQGWKLFNFIKFRSMFTHLSTGEGFGGKEAEKMYEKLINSTKNMRDKYMPKIEDDPRVTKIWKFLRKTSLDELPQLFCVLMWTMSLIWPRPHLPREVEHYEDWQKRLLSVKPWITGYAQIFWRHDNAFEEEAKLDLYYIQNWSLYLDFYVLFSTIKVLKSWD